MGDQNSKCHTCKLHKFFLEIHNEPQIKVSTTRDGLKKIFHNKELSWKLITCCGS
jgi:hypothetical protein